LNRELQVFPMDDLRPTLERFLRLVLIAALIFGLVYLVGYFLVGPFLFFQTYLFAFMFCLEFSLGALVLFLLYLLVNGGWGMIIRRILEASSRTIWVMALLFIPLLFGLVYLYPWSRPEVVAANPLLAHKTPFLNTPFFIIRAVFYFAIWIALAYKLGSWARSAEYTTNVELRRRLQRSAALGLIVAAVTITFASIDWMMSLQYDWYSAIYGLLVLSGQVLGSLAFALLLTPRLARYHPLSVVITPRHYRDLGAIMLSVVLFWAYIAYSQYVIIWAGNLPFEVTWYINRSDGGWVWVGIFIIVVQFALPFLALLSVHAKRNPRVLMAVGSVIIGMRLVDYFWHVAPAFRPGMLYIHWLDLVAPLTLGAIWLAAFIWQFQRTPLVLPPDLEVPTTGEPHREGITT
jgi:hypothetical protein